MSSLPARVMLPDWSMTMTTSLGPVAAELYHGRMRGSYVEHVSPPPG